MDEQRNDAPPAVADGLLNNACAPLNDEQAEQAAAAIPEQSGGTPDAGSPPQGGTPDERTSETPPEGKERKKRKVRDGTPPAPPTPPQPNPPKDGKKRVQHPGKKSKKVIAVGGIVEFDAEGIAELETAQADYLLSIPGYKEIKEGA